MDVTALRQWVDEGWSVGQIAAGSGYSRAGVYKPLRRHGLAIATRPAVAEDDPTMLAEIARLYRDDRLSLRAIGAWYGRGEAWVRTRVRACGIAARPVGRTPSRGRDPEVLRRYVAEGLSTEQIAEQVDRTAATVREWLRGYGIAVPPPRTRSGPRLPDSDLLRGLYVEQRHTIAEIAAQLHVSADRVRAGLIAAGIERRQPGSRADPAKSEPLSATDLRELYELRQ